MRALGVDVSHWKPVKNWSELYNSGVRFFGAKATEGNKYVDPTLRTHRDESRRQPFLLSIFYHFARSGDPRAQANRLQDAVGDLRPNERLCLDLEVSPTDDPKDALDWVDKFFETLMGGACSDRRPLIYTSKRIWRMIGDPAWDLASEVDLWSPRYNAQMIEPIPALPWAAAGWSFWQWSDGETPPVVTPGIGRCDVNYFKGDEAALAEYAKLRL
jgi:GH25 family lysozyme M1 (1,4-beta-N-acetylmuramidase)